MKRAENRSHCPVNYALESFGDSWSLLIVRDIVFFGKKTYSEFLESEEHIATNMLASRLIQLEQKGILAKARHPSDKRKEVYHLTDKGLDLIPILLEMGVWSSAYDSQSEAPREFINLIQADRYRLYDLVRRTVQAGGSVFAGPGCVVSQLPLGTAAPALS